MRAAWAGVMETGEASGMHYFLTSTPAKALIPRIERGALRLRSLADLNRTVHLPTYNKLIGEEALALQADT